MPLSNTHQDICGCCRRGSCEHLEAIGALHLAKTLGHKPRFCVYDNAILVRLVCEQPLTSYRFLPLWRPRDYARAGYVVAGYLLFHDIVPRRLLRTFYIHNGLRGWFYIVRQLGVHTACNRFLPCLVLDRLCSHYRCCASTALTPWTIAVSLSYCPFVTCRNKQRLLDLGDQGEPTVSRRSPATSWVSPGSGPVPS